jgi:hypothetical protein
MKLHTIDNFLTDRSQAAPKGNWRGVAIHPSSEVDLVDVGGYRLTVGGVVPWPTGGADIQPVRHSPGGYANPNIETAQHLSLDGLHVVGEKLVLAFYEECDALVPLGSRAPVFRTLITGDGNVPELLEDAQCMMRIPMQGRSRAVISFARDEALDLTVIVVGRRIPVREAGYENGSYGSTLVAAASETWFDGGASPPELPDGNYAMRQINIENECYDELDVYVHGEAGGSGSTTLSAEAFGEAVNL